jgi:hypothetical protein
MNTLKQALQELLGLFVEDGSLALAILVLVAAAALLVAAAAPKLLVGALLLGGSVALLAENVLRAQRGTNQRR